MFVFYNPFPGRMTVSLCFLVNIVMFLGRCRCRYAVKVVSGEGTVSGLLNIAKCLYEAIHRLEKKAMKSEAEKGNSGEAQKLAVSLLKV